MIRTGAVEVFAGCFLWCLKAVRVYLILLGRGVVQETRSVEMNYEILTFLSQTRIIKYFPL